MTFKDLYEWIGKALAAHPELADYKAAVASECGISGCNIADNEELFAYKDDVEVGHKGIFILTDDDRSIKCYKYYGYQIITKTELLEDQLSKNFQAGKISVCKKCGWIDKGNLKICPSCGIRLGD